jgi:hypothetical protein
MDLILIASINTSINTNPNVIYHIASAGAAGQSQPARAPKKKRRGLQHAA